MENYERFYKIGYYLGFFYCLIFILLAIYNFISNYNFPNKAVEGLIYTLIATIPFAIGTWSLYKKPNYNWANNIFAFFFIAIITLYIGYLSLIIFISLF